MSKIWVMIMSAIFLTGCSFFQETDGTVQYVEEATQYIQRLRDFAAEIPQMAVNATTNEEIYSNLNEQVTRVIEEIQQFNDIDVPAIAQDVHHQFIEKNEALLTELTGMLENGQVALDQLTNSEVFQTIADIATLLNLVNQITGG